MSNSNPFDTQVTSLVSSVDTTIISIEDEDQYHLAGELLREIKTLHTRIIDHHKPIEDQIKLALDTTKQQKQSLLTPLDIARGRLESMRVGYRARVKAAQEEIQRRLEQVTTDSAIDHAVNEVVELVSQGRMEEAEEITNRIGKGEIKPISTVPLKLAPPKSEGVGVRVLKRFRVVDIDKVGREYMVVDSVKINRVIRIHGGKKAEEIVGGIEYYEEESEIVRGLD